MPNTACLFTLDYTASWVEFTKEMIKVSRQLVQIYDIAADPGELDTLQNERQFRPADLRGDAGGSRQGRRVFLALQLGDHRAAEGHCAPALRQTGHRRPHAGPHEQGPVSGRLGRGLPLSGAHVSLGADRLHHGRAIAGRHRRDDGSLRRGRCPTCARGARRHAQPVGAHHVLAHAQAARGGSRTLRSLGAPRRDSRRRSLPAQGQGGDVRVVGADPARVLRRDRAERPHLRRARGLARAPRNRGPCAARLRGVRRRRRGAPLARGRDRRGGLRRGLPVPLHRRRGIALHALAPGVELAQGELRTEGTLEELRARSPVAFTVSDGDFASLLLDLADGALR